MSYTEDTLVQQTTAEYLRDELRWESVYAYSNMAARLLALIVRIWHLVVTS